MATLQKIRDRAGLLIAIVIGLALLAFVLGDLLNTGSSVFVRQKMEIAEVDGRSISITEYEERVADLEEIYKINSGQENLDQATVENIREQAWQSMIQEYVTEDEFEKLGIGISDDEVFDMVQGRDPHPIIRQIFTDPQTNMFNRSGLLQFLRSMDQDQSGAQRTFWLYLERQIINDRALNKYNNLIGKGMYATRFEARLDHRQSNRRVDASYIVRRFNTVPDTAITFGEKDLKNYYEKHKYEYRQEASRDIEYVVFDIVPSKSDYAAAEKWINDMYSDFASAENMKQFVSLNSDSPYDETNYKKEGLPDTLQEFMFNAEIGDIFGPYFENDSWKIARLAEINYLPDSVRARHILIQPTQQMPFAEAEALADSLAEAIRGGSNFAEIANEVSADNASALQGGDLGWFEEGTMVKPFNDAAFDAEVGEIQVVESRFGFHILEVLNRGPEVKKVQVALLERKVEPSSKTYDNIYARAANFAGQNRDYESFQEAAAQRGYNVRVATDLTAFQKNIPGLEYPREMIRWAFEAKENDVSDVFEFGDKYVVAALTEVREEGYAPFESKKAEIELEVKKQKKGEKISREIEALMQDHQNLDELAREMDLLVQEAPDLRFATVSIPGAGIEPKVIAAAVVLDENEISKPVTGNNGVYVIGVNSITEAGPEELELIRGRMLQVNNTQANFQAIESLRDASDIEDNRANFY